MLCILVGASWTPPLTSANSWWPSTSSGRAPMPRAGSSTRARSSSKPARQPTLHPPPPLHTNLPRLLELPLCVDHQNDSLFMFWMKYTWCKMKGSCFLCIGEGRIDWLTEGRIVSEEYGNDTERAGRLRHGSSDCISSRYHRYTKSWNYCHLSYSHFPKWLRSLVKHAVAQFIDPDWGV